MKIVNFRSGLGNQVFYYLFYLYLIEKHPRHRIYGYFNANMLIKHNGLELDKVFDLSLPPHTLLSDGVAWLCRKLNALGFKGLKATDADYSESAIYFDGWWQDKKYFLDNINKVKFRHYDLDEHNIALLNHIMNSQSVFIHIRRGDYLAPEHILTYGGICTEEYYQKAINIIMDKFENPNFFVFSNDIEWVKKHMSIPNPTFVCNNTGENSFIDMYLMSHCKAAILANSSFSYWGAMLNSNNPMVIYPGKWFNSNTPDIFPDLWNAL